VGEFQFEEFVTGKRSLSDRQHKYYPVRQLQRVNASKRARVLARVSRPAAAQHGVHDGVTAFRGRHPPGRLKKGRGRPFPFVCFDPVNLKLARALLRGLRDNYLCIESIARMIYCYPYVS